VPQLSLKNLLASAALATPDRFEDWKKGWQVASANGSHESLLEFISRKAGIRKSSSCKSFVNCWDGPMWICATPRFRLRRATRFPPRWPFNTTRCRWIFRNNVLRIAVSNPFDIGMINAVQFDARCSVEFALAPRAEVEKALKKYYGVGAETLDELAKDEPMELLVAEDKEITEGDQEASVIKFVNQIIWEAFKDRSTDIHFEPAEDELRIRYRIDGILHQTPMPPQLKRYQAAIISRIKVMSGMNIAEKRLPQDGRINVRIKGEELDIRVSTVRRFMEKAFLCGC